MAHRDEIEKRLSAIDESISMHPLGSAPVREAFAVIEKHGKEHREAISQELFERDLPSLDELGKLQLTTTLGWWRLHRTRRSLLNKLGRDVE